MTRILHVTKGSFYWHFTAVIRHRMATLAAAPRSRPQRGEQFASVFQIEPHAGFRAVLRRSPFDTIRQVHAMSSDG